MTLRLRVTRATLSADVTAGLTTALVTIPDGMASAILAGVNPVHGLYALMAGTPVAALFTSSEFMYVANTGALAVAVGSVLAGYEGAETAAALAVITVLAGIFQLLLGLLRLGSITRFISNAVLVGFMSGIGLLIILSQLGELTGYHSEYSNKVLQGADLLLHLNQVQLPTLGIGLLTLFLILSVERTRFAKFAMILALAGASLVLVLFNLDVAQVADIAFIPAMFPRPALIEFARVPELVTGAVAVAIIGLIQATGVSKSVPNPDGSFSEVSRDFTGQGIGNVVAGVFQGMPIGGTMSETAVNVGAGARSRWANIFSGLFIIIFVILFSGLVSQFAMPAIAALLIVAGYHTLNFEEIRDVWDVGALNRMVMVVTLAATLALPVQYAVLLGVVISILLYVYQSSVDIQVAELRLEEGQLVEHPAPSRLAHDSVTLLQVWGSTFFAGAHMLETMLPDPVDAQGAVVIMRLRGRNDVGSTFIAVLERYAAQLQAGGGKLMLSGVGERVRRQIERTETTEAIPREDIFMATPVMMASTRQAVRAARNWQVRDHGHAGVTILGAPAAEMGSSEPMQEGADEQPLPAG